MGAASGVAAATASGSSSGAGTCGGGAPIGCGRAGAGCSFALGAPMGAATEAAFGRLGPDGLAGAAVGVAARAVSVGLARSTGFLAL